MLAEKMPPVPVDKTPHMDTAGFELINCLHAYNKVPVFEYKSKDTGLTVIVAEVEGPVINGYFTLATEAFDDDGLPHTLEHLIFLGSEEYPFKGVLDLLANRCLASGTNAWTDIDHTCYTMETAGSDGFLALMPIFLEHILYPILSEEAFVTEVHHITPQGDDAGVVYCEMQGRENSAEARLHLNMARAMYPGHCGYSSETGGIMKNLRESTNNEKVRAYHQKFYRPENLKVVIVGQVKHEDIFKALSNLERKIKMKGNRVEFERPWQNPVPSLTDSKDLLIKYPTDDESNGLFCIGWRGPSAVSEYYTFTAIGIFLKYLTEFPTYTLPKEFVEIEDPYASNVDYSILENSESCIYFVFQDVPLPKLSLIKAKILELFKRIVETGDINMERLQNVIKRAKLEQLSMIENCPQQTIAFFIIGYLLYGNTKQDMEQRGNPLNNLTKLLNESKSFWVSLMKRYLVDNKYILVECVPSKDEQKKMAEEEAIRIKGQQENLGEAGLKEKEQILQDAINVNEKEPPKEMLTCVPIPNIKSVNFHNLIRYRTDLDERKQIDLSKTPLFTCFDHVKSEFIYMYAILDSSHVPAELRVYIPLILEALFELPINRDDKIIPYEVVVEELNNDTVSFNTSIGLGSKSLFNCGPYSQSLFVMLQVESAKYEQGIKWLRDILYNVVFSIERLKIIATKINNAVAQAKRSGRDVVAYAMRTLRYTDDCNTCKNGMLVQNKFLSELIEKCNEDVGENCSKVWKILTNPNYVTLHIMGNLNSFKSKPEALLNNFLPANLEPVKNKLNVSPDQKLLKQDTDCNLNGCLIGMGCLESSFFYQTIDSISNMSDPDLPGLMLYLQYLIQTEGLMWRQIRGKGYAYGYTMLIKPNEGLLYLIFSKATNVVGAYTQAREILYNQIHKQEWDLNLLDSARSSLIFELIGKEKTIGNIIHLSMLSYFDNVEFEYNRTLLDLIQNVTIQELNRIGEKYLSAFFDPKRIKSAIVSVPAKVQAIADAFKNFGIDLTVYPSLEESFLKC